MNVFVKALIAFVAVATLALAADLPSIERGKQLFDSTNLGTNGKSCSTCHPDGSGMDKAASYVESRLGKMVNQCIQKPLKGQALASDSPELKSLIMYIQALAKPAKK
jgi:cytochrome c